MFIPRLYYPKPLSVQSSLTLDKSASHYLAQVVRVRPNSKIILFNGEGGEYHGEITDVNKTTTVKIKDFDPINRSSSLNIVLGQAIARGDRMDLIVQKATELGIHALVPLTTQKSIVKLDEKRQAKRHQHWQQIVISACEQCGLNTLPAVASITRLIDWCQQPFDGLSIMLDPGATASLKTLTLPSNKKIRLAVGCESGWSEEERMLLAQHDFQAFHLGQRILRTETAGMAALSILQGLWGDLT